MKIIDRIRKTPPLALFALFAFAAGSARAASTHIVVHKDLTVSKLSPDDLESIYLGKKTLWESGAKIAPVILVEDSPGGREFIEQVLAKTVAQYRAYWKRRLFSGGGTVPRAFSSSAEIVDFVGKTPGAIGVIESPSKDERVKSVPLAK